MSWMMAMNTGSKSNSSQMISEHPPNTSDYREAYFRLFPEEKHHNHNHIYITSYSGIKNVCPLECNVFPHCLNLILNKQSSKYKPGPIKLHKSSSDSHFMTRGGRTLWPSTIQTGGTTTRTWYKSEYVTVIKRQRRERERERERRSEMNV